MFSPTLPPPSPSPSTSSSRSSTLSRPPPPPKPSHLSSAFTGTLNSVALHEYIQAQKTGGSFSSVRSESRLSTLDARPPLLDPDEDQDPSSQAPSSRNRSNTAPSLGYLLGGIQAKHLTQEPLTIDAASKGFDLRSMWDPPTLPYPSSSKPENTTVKPRSQPKPSLRRIMQPSTYASSSGSTLYSTARPVHQHAYDHSDIYSTAKTFPEPEQPSGLEATHSLSDATLDLDPLADTLTSHDRDDSSATIKPTRSHSGTSLLQDGDQSTMRVVSPRRPSRLSHVFAASSSSITTNAIHDALSSPLEDIGDEEEASPSPEPEHEQRASILNEDGERSREPSVLVSFNGGDAHMRVNDGSSFDFDWKASMEDGQSSEKVTSEEAKEAVATTPSPAVLMPVARQGRGGPNTIVFEAGPPPQRPGSIVLSLEAQVDGDCGATKGVADREDDEAASQAAAVTSAVTPVGQVQDGSAPGHFPANLSGAKAAAPLVPQPGMGRQARALYDFQGEASFNELSLQAGQSFEVLNEELAGGWSLGLVWEEVTMPGSGRAEVVPRRGLVPRGWYCYIQDFTISPPPAQGIEPPPTPSPYLDEGDHRVPVATEDAPQVGPSPSLSSTGPAGQTPAVVGIDHSNVAGGTLSTKAANGQDALRALSHVAEASGGSTAAALLTTPEKHGLEEQKTPRAFKASEADPLADQDLLYLSLDGHLAKTAQLEKEEEEEEEEVEAVEAVEQQAGAKAPDQVSLSSQGWRASLFGGKSLNRFSSFVTSGAEDYLLSKEEDAVRGGSAAAAALRSLSSDAPPSRNQNQIVDDEADRHFVLAGPSGPKWKSKAPHFFVQVHSPEKRTKMSGMQEYMVFCVTSTFPAAPSPNPADRGDQGETTCWEDDPTGRVPYDPTSPPFPAGPSISVYRRFTQFSWLSEALSKLYPALVLPPLPEKQYSGRFSTDFIETRRVDLELWIGSVVRHPVLRYSEAVLFFLSCDDEVEWKRKSGKLLKGAGRDGNGGTGASKGGSFFSRTWHPEFNFDPVEATLEGEAMDAHLRAYEKTMNGVGGNNNGKGGIMNSWRGLREGVAAASEVYRDLSFSLLRLITGVGVNESGGGGGGGANRHQGGNAGSTGSHHLHGPPMGDYGKRSLSGATNESGAWCWREGCQECSALTKALQGTAESLQVVADLYDDHAREGLLRQHERLKAISRPHAQFSSLIETHRATLERYREATGEPDPLGTTEEDEEGYDVNRSEKGRPPPPVPAAAEAERLAARCETVINVTLSEMDRIHDERVEDWLAAGRNFLDGEIEFYEDVLETLRSARRKFSAEHDHHQERETTSHAPPILASRYQHELHRSKVSQPLRMPSNPVVPSSGLMIHPSNAMRPVSLAAEVVSEGLGSLLLGGSRSFSSSSSSSSSSSTSFLGVGYATTGGGGGIGTGSRSLSSSSSSTTLGGSSGFGSRTIAQGVKVPTACKGHVLVPGLPPPSSPANAGVRSSYFSLW